MSANLFANVGGQLIDVRVFPIQIREDHTVRVFGVPYDLTLAEAEKIGRVVRALAQADRNPEGHDPEEGHGAKHESPVGEADAPERCSEHSIHSSSGRG